MRISITLWCVLWILFSSCRNELSPETVIRPNFFLFLADDLSYPDLGYTGNPYVLTPSIDKFAKESVEFKKMYTPSAMCAPSRSALFTGLYPHRNGCHMNHGEIKEGIRSLPQYLKPLGYKVALVGKRHIKPASSFPFDYVKFEELDNYLSKVNSPVCVIFASNEPHGPHLDSDRDLDDVIIPPKWLDTKSTREALAGYYADIDAMDKEFDNLMQIVNKYNLDDHSVTIFTSDHGNEYFAKWSCYEAGLKVPFFMQTKGIDITNQPINQLTSFVDIVPTFQELAGGTVSNDLDGKSMVALLKGNDIPIRNYIYGSHTTRGHIFWICLPYTQYH